MVSDFVPLHSDCSRVRAVSIGLNFSRLVEDGRGARRIFFDWLLVHLSLFCSCSDTMFLMNSFFVVDCAFV